MTVTYSQCWRDSLSTRKNYDVYVRTREDVGFHEPVHPGVFSTVESSQNIAVSSYRSWGGINDRVSIVGPLAAECYFNLPFVNFFDASYLDVAMLNAESYCKVRASLLRERENFF